MLSLVIPNDPPSLLERLFAESSADLGRYFSRRHGGEETARDLVQETFLQMARSLEDGRHVQSGRGYLFGIARRVSQACWSARAHHVETPMDAATAELAAPQEDDRIQAARETIATLDAVQREVLDLRFAQGLSYAEIAEALSIPLGTVRSRLHHAVAEVRQQLEKEDLL